MRVTNPYDDLLRLQRRTKETINDTWSCILEDDGFRKVNVWEDTSLSTDFFWIREAAGEGKSMLLVAVLRHLLKLLRIRSPSLCFVFLESKTKLDNMAAAMRSLIWMLVVQQSKLVSHLKEEYDQSGGRDPFAGINGSIALARVFQSMIVDADPVMFVVDALDECDQEQDDLVEVIGTSLRSDKRPEFARQNISGYHGGLPKLYDHKLDSLKQEIQVNKRDWDRFLQCVDVLRLMNLSQSRLLSVLELEVLRPSTADKCEPIQAVSDARSFFIIEANQVDVRHEVAGEFLRRSDTIRQLTTLNHEYLFTRSIERLSNHLKRDIGLLKDWASETRRLESCTNGRLTGLEYCWLNLLRRIPTVLLSLRTLRAKLLLRSAGNPSPTSGPLRAAELAVLLTELLKYVGRFMPVLGQYPLQVYGGPLVFSPERSMIKEHFRQEGIALVGDVDGPDDISGIKDDWGLCQQRLGSHCGPVTVLCFAPDGQMLASGSSGQIKLWAIDSTNVAAVPVRSFQVEGEGEPCIAFSRDSSLLATPLSGTIRLWAINAETETATPKTTLIEDKYFSSGGRLAFASRPEVQGFSQNEDGNPGLQTDLFLWDIDCSTKAQHDRRVDTETKPVVFSPEGRPLMTSWHSRITLCEDINSSPESQVDRKVLHDHNSLVTSLAFSPNGTFIVSADKSSASSQGSSIDLKPSASPQGPSRATDGSAKSTQELRQYLAFSSNGERLVSLDENGSLRIWIVSADGSNIYHKERPTPLPEERS
ncbi:WD40 repeat domain-containing protein [Aspergillus homomorphus CBS 101889]|uniref:WD40 repeat-like protein n=1 Tax=Aspergillus homomorphus (strain CBS 101889) TaxID=1450537 RepID=A0A395I288_ASPHC|nr:WD40 repeat-like protein [Aspergillus homomorphus CBS 101889]RAL14180.1 WD40 repeat-like protein [Aspergillus homomorphus CBS 101889]